MNHFFGHLTVFLIKKDKEGLPDDEIGAGVRYNIEQLSVMIFLNDVAGQRYIP
jgi:hypothetical protein